jgi:hypothetical protein
MLMSVVNNSSTLTLNALDVLSGGTGPSALFATGGNRTNPLPYPFNMVTIGPSATLVLPAHHRDMDRQKPSFNTHSPSEAWNQMIQAGTVTVTYATESTYRDTDDTMIHGI